MPSHNFNPSILREYDIRGRYGETLKESDAAALGRAFGTRVRALGGQTVAVGRDGRLSSPSLEAALCDGLIAAGVTVQRIGLGPTPMLYFATHHLQAAGGIMVTGSHNPKDDNGFKMLLGPALGPAAGSVYGQAIKDLAAIAAAGNFAEGKGFAEEISVMDAYIDRLLADWPSKARALNVVWDCGNGATGEVAARLIQRLPGRHRLLFAEIDGRFPNHHPDPTVEKNLLDLRAAMAAEKAEVGIGFDGDGDRIGALDGLGRVVAGDQLLAFYAEEVLQKNPGATIIADVKASQVFFDHVARLGGKPLMWKTGHSLVKAKMKETRSPLAGEMSGHIFFADRWYGFDDALYAALRLLAILATGQESLSAMRDRLPKTEVTPEMRIPCADARKFIVMDETRARLKAAGAQMNDTDGVRISTPDGWWLLRASNTQPVLVARAEARDDAGLARLQANLQAELQASGIEFALTDH